jgi:hypothetical protein
MKSKIIVSHGGKSAPIAHWAKTLGITTPAMYKRIYRLGVEGAFKAKKIKFVYKKGAIPEEVRRERERKYGIRHHIQRHSIVGEVTDVPQNCESCGDAFSKTPHLDHCHETKQFRGWLCGGCNTGLGMFMDSEDRLIKAVAYLERFKQRQK